jgi:DNA-binding GntR family transcriptional regulator
MQAVFEKLANSTLRRQIADKIRDAILHGSLQEGQRLVERNLASQFATSLTAVREALIELEAEGFVTKRPNAATHVTKLTLDSAEKIFSVRRILEVYAVEEAARLATPEHIAEIEKHYSEMLRAAEARDAKRFITSDFSLHEATWAATQNEYLQVALRRIVLPIFAFTSIRIVTRSHFDLVRDAQSHLPFLDAIRGRRPEAARASFLGALEEWRSNTRAYVFGDSAGS